MSYADTERTRQKILDHLHANPRESAKQIWPAINEGRNRTEACLHLMVARGELERIGSGQGSLYVAIATTTVSAETIIAETQERREKKRLEMAHTEHGKVERQGYYSQRGGNWKATSSGGQGALRQAVGVACSFGMV